MAFSPGGKREPETIAASVSSTWCLPFSATSFGKALLSAPAIYVLTRVINGDTSVTNFFIASIFFRISATVLCVRRDALGGDDLGFDRVSQHARKYADVLYLFQ